MGRLVGRIIPRLALAVSTVFVLSSGTLCAQGESTAEAHANRAAEEVQAGNLETAEAELRSAVRLAPGANTYLAGLGTVLAMEKKFAESNAIFKKVLAVTPRDVTVRRYLAANLWQMHHYPEARENLEILLKQAPKDNQSRLLLGMVSENMKDYTKAAEILASVPEQTEQRPESIVALARSYYHLNRTADARSALDKLSRFPAATNAVFLGAQIADEAGDYATAEQMLISISPDAANQPIIGYRIALAQFHAKQFDESRRTLLNLIGQNTGSSEVYNLLGWCYHNQNESSKARQTFELAIELFPTDEANYLDLSKILIVERSFSAALRVAKQATLAFPKSARALELKGLAEEKAEQFTDAVNSYSQAWHLDRTRSDALLGVAQAQASASMTKESATTFELGMKTFPQDLRFKVQYASVLLKQAETGDALAETRGENLLKSALAANPSLPAAHYELGNLALRKGRTAEALLHLEEAEKLAPKSSQVHFALANAYRRMGRKDKSSEEMDLYQKLNNAPETPTTPEPASQSPN